MLVDTTVLIDFLRGKEKAVEALRKAETGLLYTTEINVFELIVGVYLATEQVTKHLERVNMLVSRLTVLPLDRNASLLAGRIAAMLIKEGRRIEETDCLIAAIGLSHGLDVVLTDNKDHFERIKEIKVVSY